MLHQRNKICSKYQKFFKPFEQSELRIKDATEQSEDVNYYLEVRYMNIGIDIDDTIAKTSEETDIYAKEYTEKVLNRKFEFKQVEILDPMWAKHLYGWSSEENDNIWDLYYEKIMENVKPKDDAIEIINELSKENNIIIITARWDRENGIINEITKHWLDTYNINYNKLFIGHEDKRNIAKENEIDLFIDDNFKTCKQISEIGIKTLLMNSRINKDMKTDNLERVFSWKEIAEKIKEVN